MEQVSIILKENAIADLPACLNTVRKSNVYVGEFAKKVLLKVVKHNKSITDTINQLKSLS